VCKGKKAYIVAQLYELSDEDFEALKRYWDFAHVAG
jgi:hypothetical protein